MLSLVAIVCETLTAASDQVISRSYGNHSLQLTVEVWENLYRQIRVSLILTGFLNFLGDTIVTASVHDMDSSPQVATDRLQASSISIYRVLALDTLSITKRADHAVDHENLCRERSSTKVIQGGKKNSPLSAWIPLSDPKWRDLLNSIPTPSGKSAPTEIVGVASLESVTGPVTGSGSGSRSFVEGRLHLLTLFPQHNQPSILAVYRAIELSER